MLRTVRVLAENGPVRVEIARLGGASGRLVVVKRLVAFHPTLERRLAREAEVVAKLQHPGILPLLETRAGALVYPFVPAPTLAAVLRGGPLPAPRVVHFAAALLAALADAHAHGVVHHDVKPDNVLVRGDRALLTDFGFAKDLGSAAITGADTALGTPHYMAPEQFDGARGDPRSDLYALTATLYHAAVGTPPWGADALRVAAGGADLPLDPPPGDAAPLAPWFARGLARDPADRWPDADAMRAALPGYGREVAA